MKRDCGSGELIPTKWVVVWDSGMNDNETESKHPSLEVANLAFEAKRTELAETNCSGVRLYICDKQGYMNCVKNWTRTAQGTVHETNRFNEL